MVNRRESQSKSMSFGESGFYSPESGRGSGRLGWREELVSLLERKTGVSMVQNEENGGVELS